MSNKVLKNQEYIFRGIVNRVSDGEADITTPSVARRFDVNKYDRYVSCAEPLALMSALVVQYMMEGWVVETPEFLTGKTDNVLLANDTLLPDSRVNMKLGYQNGVCQRLDFTLYLSPKKLA